MTYSDELAVAIRASTAAAEAMAQGEGDLRDAGGTDAKENVNDLVTEYDRQSQAAVVDRITAAFPEDSLVGEEDAEGIADAPSGSGREWIIDPIDGTANFAVGFPYYCVSIAFAVDGETQVGVVASPGPGLDRCFYAVRGEGAYVARGLSSVDPENPGGEELSVTDQDDLSGAFLFARLSERNTERRRIDGEILETIMDRGSKFRRAGSAALNLAYVAAGQADGYVVLSLQPWDIDAGILLVREAGGTVRTQKARVEEDATEMIATNGPLQETLDDIVDAELD